MNNKFEIGKETAIKYIMFKKRTEKEVRAKLEFLNYSTTIINRIVDYLKETGYIDDQKYLERYMQELKALKNWSGYQVKADLYKRGFTSDIDESMINKYELNSIKNLYGKFKLKYDSASEEEVENFSNALRKKGFKSENIKKVIK